jgi:hypothetical protein
MIKYFHKLTKEEFDKLDKQMTWVQFAKKYPQPKWCIYPEAVNGMLGCWSLVKFLINGKKSCKNCEYCKGDSHATTDESVSKS